MKSKIGVILAALDLAGCSQIDTGNVGVVQNEAEAIKKWDGKLPTTMAGNSQAFIPLGGK